MSRPKPGALTKITVSAEDVTADLEWLEVSHCASWREKAKALYEDNPAKYRICALARHFKQDARWVARVVGANVHKFDKVRRAERRRVTQKAWYEEHKFDEKFKQKRAEANRRHRAKLRNNAKIRAGGGLLFGLELQS